MSLAILFHFLCVQHVSEINIYIIRSLRLCCWITTFVVLFLVRCVLEIWCGWVWVVFVLKAEAHFLCTQHVSDINISFIRSLLLCCWITTSAVLFSVRCVIEIWCVSVLQAASACNTDNTPTQPHRNSSTHRTKNNTTNVVIQQNSHKLLMMYILVSETCWAHKKWNKIASDIKMVFCSSTVTMMHGPINIRCIIFVCSGQTLYQKYKMYRTKLKIFASKYLL